VAKEIVVEAALSDTKTKGWKQIVFTLSDDGSDVHGRRHLLAWVCRWSIILQRADRNKNGGRTNQVHDLGVGEAIAVPVRVSLSHSSTLGTSA
jgi:hypothetical protein